MTYITTGELRALAALPGYGPEGLGEATERLGFEVDRDYEISGVPDGLLRVTEVLGDEQTVEVIGGPPVRLPGTRRHREWLVAEDGTIELAL